jgi:hypothetical protein
VECRLFIGGTYPGPLSNATVSGINVPIRIGKAVIMPGDLIIGDQDGILAIPPQFVPKLIYTVTRDRRRDVWMKKALIFKSINPVIFMAAQEIQLCLSNMSLIWIRVIRLYYLNNLNSTKYFKNHIDT